jgi:hypothetical protein
MSLRRPLLRARMPRAHESRLTSDSRRAVSTRDATNPNVVDLAIDEEPSVPAFDPDDLSLQVTSSGKDNKSLNLIRTNMHRIPDRCRFILRSIL